MSLAAEETGDDLRRLVYAQTPLLAQAGFGPGSYDPPTMACVIQRQQVATA
jgi:hypothetical protein